MPHPVTVSRHRVAAFAAIITCVVFNSEHAHAEPTDSKAQKPAATRQLLMKRVGIESVWTHLDGILILDSHQEASIRELLVRTFEPNWAERGMNSLLGNYHALPLNTPYDEIESVLDEHQRSHIVLLRMVSLDSGFGNLGRVQVASGPQANEWREAFEEQLDLAIHLRVRQLSQQFTLDDAQQKKLAVLAKGVKLTLRKRWKRATHRCVLAIRIATERDEDPHFDSGDTRFLSQMAGTQLAESPVWVENVGRILSGENRDAYKQAMALREKRSRAALVAALTLAFDHKFGDSELKELHALFERSLTKTPVWSDWAIGRVVLEIPQDEYIAAVGRANWIWIESQLDAVAAHVEMLRRIRKMAAPREE